MDYLGFVITSNFLKNAQPGNGMEYFNFMEIYTFPNIGNCMGSHQL